MLALPIKDEVDDVSEHLFLIKVVWMVLAFTVAHGRSLLKAVGLPDLLLDSVAVWSGEG